MKTIAAYRSEVMESMERMTDQILALRALSGILAACDSTPIKLSELTYLLDPIIEKQEALVEELMHTKNVVHLSAKPGKTQPLSIADNP